MIHRGVRIEYIKPQSPAQRAGLKEGDIILSINGHAIKDVLDLMYYSVEDILKVKFLRENKKIPRLLKNMMNN
ncbi:hypothetical protein THER_1000 [Thermodesulfovibrio sp. N1]|uniref:PDZ domain-containing protein n=1 Tax=Thermodesulfovibrio sp. N1 TaxID=1871110 RepID=UPI000858EC4A|nr:PDZ domain-containing protein [Thermodesulfovibrio sp. N1]ODA44302.1 hypothetical protein THER_1000 [Thermodesulfovibrio sp. N1]